MKTLLNNWQLKILSVGAAALLWVFVVGIQNSVFPFPELLEVKVTDLAKNLSIGDKIPGVKIYLRTEGEFNKKTLNKNDIEVSIDLANKQSGTHELPILVSTTNPKISIVKVEPSTVKVQLVPMIEKELKVNPKIKGVPAKGFEIEKIEIQTNKAKIKAGQSFLDSINSLDAVVNLNGTEDTTFKQIVQITAPVNEQMQNKNVTIDPETVEVTVNIKPLQKIVETQEVAPENTEKTTRTLQVPVILSGSNPNFSVEKITPTSVSISLEGQSNLLNTLAPGAVVVTIDLSKIPGAGPIQISNENIQIPEGTRLLNWDPQTIIIEQKGI